MALKILTRKDVDKVLDALDLQAAVDSQAAVFAAFSGPKKQDGAFQTSFGTDHPAPGIPSLQLPLRHVLTSPEQTMLFMPGRVDSKTAIKIVSVPTSGGDGLPGTTLIMDEISGRVRAVVNARRLTAQRNAAGGLLPNSFANVQVRFCRTSCLGMASPPTLCSSDLVRRRKLTLACS